MVQAGVQKTTSLPQPSDSTQSASSTLTDVVAAQVRSVVGDIGVGAAKTGMLATAGIIEAVADVVDEVGIGRDDDRIPFLVDPVAASMYGEPLLAEDAMEAIRTRLFPRAALTAYIRGEKFDPAALAAHDLQTWPPTDSLFADTEDE